MMRLGRLLAALTLALATAACATGARRTGDAVSRLEAERQARPNSAPVLRALGIAYYKAGRYGDAYQILERARSLDPRDGTTALYTGLAAEQIGDLKAARVAYASYLDHGRTKRVRSQLQARLAALNRRQLVEDARTAVQNEQTLATQAGDARTVAVLPFRFTGTDSTLRPLERGMAELIVTDLGQVRALTVVERERMQALLDEMQLARSGAVDATTGVRAGKLVRAGRLVQGSLTELPQSSLRVDAAVVDVTTSQASGGATADDKLEQLFAMEKRIVFDLINSMGVSVTAEERRKLEERPTRSLAAFLAYSAGLMAQDNGDFDTARQFFGEAIRIDPSFGAAAFRQQQSQQIQAGAVMSTASVEQTVQAGSEGDVVEAAQQGEVTGGTEETGTLANTVESINPGAASSAIENASTGSSTTNPANQNQTQSQTTGSGQVTTKGTITIIVTQPRVQP